MLEAHRKRGAALGFALLLAGCGGGGGGGSAPAPPPVPPPPPPPPEPPAGIRFVPVTDVGLRRPIANTLTRLSDAERASGGVAAADYDGDGDVDLYVVGDSATPNHFYENRGDGTFVEAGARLGVDFRHWGSGPAFGDIDGDGDLDLFVGAVGGDRHYLLENRVGEAAGRFVDVTDTSGIALSAANTVSATFADYDQDGFVDLFLAHWGTRRAAGASTETVWRNNGDGTFTDASVGSGIAAALIDGGTDWSFTPNLADIDDDGDGDLLLTADFGASHVFRNNGDGTFTRTTDRTVIADEAGKGAALADFDNDGDFDWFVTSTYNLDAEGGPLRGNRLYRNDGNGAFADATEAAGVADGGWGWGACAADFDNDGAVDLAHVNGWIEADGKDYAADTVRFFHNTGAADGDVAFRERGAEVGLGRANQGRGIACFDLEGDGDIDIVIATLGADGVHTYRNDTTNDNHYLGVRLEGVGGNRFGVGARVTITAGGATQMRALGAASNYASHDPLEAHFGLGAATTADVVVRWPDGARTSEEGVAADRIVTMRQPPPALRLSVVGGDGDGVYAPGDIVPVQAGQAPENYHFSHWTARGGGTFADPYAAATTFTMPASAVTITAHYTPGVARSANVSVARRWNEVLLQSIRNDFARPTVHARNLFHVSAAMYDAWASYGDATPWLWRRGRAGAACDGAAPPPPDDVEAARARAASFAAYRLIRHRFRASPGTVRIVRDADALMGALGHDPGNESTDYADDTAAALGNRIAACYIAFGLEDGANEANDYANLAYQPVNPPLMPEQPGNPGIVDLNRWQPLSLREAIDQAGNRVDSELPFLSPEWGGVTPFALSPADRTRHERDGFAYWTYHDPGPPPTIDGALADNYKWAFALVAAWSAHLTPDDGATMDISPASLGNLTSYPAAFTDYPTFFNTQRGGDPSTGHATNPVTGAPYTPQVVPRGDYARVLAEFWADGPDSETPPGHWFTILNEVHDHEALRRRFRGQGPELGLLEWDVKAYFTLGGAMHDSAIAAWGAKGWYDYIRPISALRAMADRGQSTDPDHASYHADGIPLMDGRIALVDADDPLAGAEGEHVGKIKFFAWRGPDAIDDPARDVAGVGWIRAENWWPYQRPSFVTPPFAGYVSGHSTYSRAAAEVLTAFTGDAFFPGGMSGFRIPANEFLVFERGPSVDMTLQWATYRDASDQCSLSRIWGGIHPPVDDIPGRLMGRQVGLDAFALAVAHFEGRVE